LKKNTHKRRSVKEEGEWFENENRSRSARGDGEKPPASHQPGEERFVAKKSKRFVRGVAKTLPVRALETDEKRGVDESVSLREKLRSRRRRNEGGEGAKGGRAR